jgi:hypothetical protein
MCVLALNFLLLTCQIDQLAVAEQKMAEIFQSSALK